MIRRRHTVACLAALAAPGLAPRAGRAQATAPGWPGERPIEVVVPVPPGGALDALARLLMPHVCTHLGGGARFVVINRPGAGTQVGNEAVFNAAPDGYTLGCITAPALPALPIERQVRYRTAEFAWSRYAQWLSGARGMELAERRLVPPLGHFSLVRFRKTEIAAAA